MEELKEKILNLFESLGPQSRSVAKTLISKAIKGKRGDGHYCPIAEYIKQNNSDIHLVLIDIEKSYFKTIKGHQFSVDNPNNILNFIRDFDNNKYSELYI